MQHTSFLRVEDWAPAHNHVNNQSWSELLRIIDEFEHLTEAQKKEVADCVKEIGARRIDLIKNYYNYKTALKVHGELKKDRMHIYEAERAKYFFQDHAIIERILLAVANHPQTFAKMLAERAQEKLSNQDFAQNLLYCLYPCYLPPFVQEGCYNHSLTFMETIISQWNYCIFKGRPDSYTLLDQILNGFNKAPQIVCYVEKVSMVFMQNINKCKMDYFAFDESALKHELEVKKSIAMSQQMAPAPKSRLKQFTSFFRNKKQQEYAESFLSQTSDISDHSELDFSPVDIMKSRQKDFFTVVEQTVKQILKLDTPHLLNWMFRFFHNKISNAMSLSPQRPPQPHSSLNDSLLNEDSFIQNSNDTTLFRHYCYFLMTNLIFEQLHNKFTISHEDSGMTPADLQNVTEIIRIMTHIFNGNFLQDKKYKNEQKLKDIRNLLPQIPEFYARILSHTEGLEEHPVLSLSKKEMTSFNNQESGEGSIKEILLGMHQNTLILSFSDIRKILTYIKACPKLAEELQLSPYDLHMDFLSTNLYDPKKTTVTFDNHKHEMDKILFVFNGGKPSLAEVVQYYCGKDNPLKNLPQLTNALMHGSNLTVSQAIQVTKSLNLIQSLPIKEMKYYLGKLAQRYSKLYLKDSEVISEKFRQTIEHHLTLNIQRKALLLLHRDDICSRVDKVSQLIQFYTEELQSSQFYERISHTFIQNIKIKVYMRVENDEFQVYKNLNEMKGGVHLQSILMTDTDAKGRKFSDEYLLRNSFKTFTNIRELLRCIVKHSITRSAITCGRRVDEFNEAFNKICNIIVSYIEDFMSKRELLKNLNKDRLGKTIVSNLQSHIYERCNVQKHLEEDDALNSMKKNINKKLFFEKDLKELEVDWDFLVEEGVKKFKLMQSQTSIYERMRHFEQLFRMVFTIVGFTMPKNKISAEIINPIMQYMILVSENTRHYDCLYSLQCLKWNSTPETAYNIILYQSSLVYVSQMMKNDYPL